MAASRLPGKMLADVNGIPLLGVLTARLKQASSINDIVIATTTESADDAIVKFAKREGIQVFRGSEDDVLKRVVEAHQMMGSDIIVELCGDCPLIDPKIIDLAIETFLSRECDVLTTGVHQSYPQGTEVQVFRRLDLEDVERISEDQIVREHVSLYFYEHPGLYRIEHLTAPLHLQAPGQRLQVDYPEDLELVRQICAELMPVHGLHFTTLDILELLRNNPELVRINAHCEERQVR